MSEESRAAAYRAQDETRHRAHLARQRALRGSQPDYNELLAKTEPLKRDQWEERGDYRTDKDTPVND